MNSGTCCLQHTLTALPIPGLSYTASYLAKDVQQSLLQLIDQQPWKMELRRRVQHYGYQYNYKAHRVTPQMQAAAFPDCLKVLAHQLYQDGYASVLPDQVIINEYLPGQGIAPHIDCVPCFGDIILSLSLGSACVMQFTHATNRTQVALWLEPGSLLLLTGEARYRWKHQIPARKTDIHANQRVPRQRRVSLTFRTVVRSDM